MRILGIESSCDETAAAVVEDGERLLSNVVNSQIDIHAEYGGVIPEIAARSHLEVVNPVIKKALSDADCTWDDIDAIAVTYAPGLIGSLLIGTLAARTLAIIHNKPLYKIHHVEAHVYANFVTKQGSRHIIDKSKTVEPTSAVVFEEAVTGAPSPVSRTPRAGEATRKEYSEAEDRLAAHHKSELIALLHYHLDLFDHYQPTLGRPYETLKRFFKIYIRDFDGAKELRDQLMHTKNTSEARQILEKIQCL